MLLPPGLVPDAGRAVVLVDGGSGSGKTRLAHALGQAWPSPITVVSLDAFYPGWHGLAAGSAIVADDVLHPRRPGYRAWDWTSGTPGAWVDLDPDAHLIVEGCGALTARNRALATAGIWVSAPAALRRERALTREPEFADHWDAWAAQERAHGRAHRPRALADWIVTDGVLRATRR